MPFGRVSFRSCVVLCSCRILVSYFVVVLFVELNRTDVRQTARSVTHSIALSPMVVRYRVRLEGYRQYLCLCCQKVSIDESSIEWSTILNFRSIRRLRQLHRTLVQKNKLARPSLLRVCALELQIFFFHSKNSNVLGYSSNELSKYPLECITQSTLILQ